MSTPSTRTVGDPGNDHRAASSAVATVTDSTSAPGALRAATSLISSSARAPCPQPGLMRTWIFTREGYHSAAPGRTRPRPRPPPPPHPPPYPDPDPDLDRPPPTTSPSRTSRGPAAARVTDRAIALAAARRAAIVRPARPRAGSGGGALGEETRQFATRFTRAMGLLAALPPDDAYEQVRQEHGSRLARAVREALDAVEAVYGTGTSAVRDWPERSRAVLARLADLRRAVERAGVDGEARRLAGALVELIEAGPGRA